MILTALYYCEHGIIDHFGCEYSAIITVSCSDSSFSQMACLVISILSEGSILLVTIASYVFIVSVVWSCGQACSSSCLAPARLA